MNGFLGSSISFKLDRTIVGYRIIGLAIESLLTTLSVFEDFGVSVDLILVLVEHCYEG